jgi:hypothetical protein
MYTMAFRAQATIINVRVERWEEQAVDEVCTGIRNASRLRLPAVAKKSTIGKATLRLAKRSPLRAQVIVFHLLLITGTLMWP